MEAPRTPFDPSLLKQTKYVVDEKNKIGHLKLSRPEKMNAYTERMCSEMVYILSHAGKKQSK